MIFVDVYGIDIDLKLKFDPSWDWLLSYMLEMDLLLRSHRCETQKTQSMNKE